MRIACAVLSSVILSISWPGGVLAEESTPDSTASAAPMKAQTQAKTGSHVGLVVGGITGAAMFLLVGVVAESEGEDIQPVGWVGLGALGLGLGAATGALLGYMFGSMIPTEEEPASVPGASPASTGRRPIASFALEPGVAILTERPGNESAFTLRGTLLAQLKPWLGVGPEVTYGNLAGGMFAVEGAAYVGRRDAGLRPYAVLDLGVQHWATGVVDTDVGVLGMGVGAGLSWSPRSGNAHFGLEGRYHWTPQHIENPEGFRFVNVGATARWSW
jgi:hypothetical protein